jgi:colanic acid/amylovoran biosynthesis glycosyltransferase
MYRYMFKRADMITAGSSFIMSQLVHYGCPEEKIRVLPMGVPVKAYHKEKYGNYFLSVGRLTEVKGFIYSIQAFALLARSFSEFSYYIVGNGSLYKELEGLIQSLGMKTRIFLIGEQNDQELEELYHGALAFIIPSIHTSDASEEGQGLVIQEAESYELPVIGTDTGGIPEGIIDNKTGFLVPEKDVNALYEKMLLLLQNPELCRQFGKAGRRLVLEKYDVRLLTKRMIREMYEYLLKKTA